MTINTQNEKAKIIYTASDSIMDTLASAGVEYFFVGLGSDHASIIESWAKSKSLGKVMPKIIICPHEFLTLSMAHGFAQVTGKPQAVFVHVDVGTQNLGGSIHNVMRGRIPVLIFAGMSPATAENELLGSRNEFIHYLQDVPDQSGIVRQYMKYTQTIYTGKNADKVILRALQMAQSEPKGPVYVMTPREVLAEEVNEPTINHNQFNSISAGAIEENDVKEIITALRESKNPMIITSYLGREHKSVQELICLAERFAIPVIESGPYYMNFPTKHPLHLGYEDYTGKNESIERLRKADTVLVIDCDVPWIPMNITPSEDTKIFWIDSDPIKEKIPLWYFPTTKTMKAQSYTALQQLNKYANQLSFSEQELDKFNERKKVLEIEHQELIQKVTEKAEITSSNGYITPDYLSSVVKEVIDEDTIVVNEAISNFGSVWRNIERTKPGTLYGSGASSLGWHGGGALGIKLANLDKNVVALTGDGTYMFSIPSSVHWISSKYKLPFLTVIYNNRGWKSPKLSTLGVHPEGIANDEDNFWVNFGETAKYEKIAEASGGALALEVRDPKLLKAILEQGLDSVKNGRSAVINVFLEAGSKSDLDTNI